MKEELNFPCRYKVYKDSQHNLYYFSTDTGANYSIRFIDSSHHFQTTALKDSEIYQLSIVKDSTGNGLRDEELKRAVEEIIYHFLEIDNRLIAYVLDMEGKSSSIPPHLIRYRMFQIWHCNSKYKDEIAKYDYDVNQNIKDEEPYFVGFLFLARNLKLKERIIESTSGQKSLWNAWK